MKVLDPLSYALSEMMLIWYYNQTNKYDINIKFIFKFFVYNQSIPQVPLLLINLPYLAEVDVIEIKGMDKKIQLLITSEGVTQSQLICIFL